MQQRMKQAGMRWAEANLNPMLALRVALCNQMWKTSWQEIEARILREKYPVKVRKKKLPARAVGSTVVTEADCQRLTALAARIAKKKRHPWRDHRWVFPYRENLIHEN